MPAMLDLVPQEVLWCVRHGHPVLALCTRPDDRCFTVALAADDAATFATWQHAGRDPGRARLYALLESVIADLEGRLAEVRLEVGPDVVLRASLRLERPAGETTLPASFVDGILLAHRVRVPLRIAEADLARIPASPFDRPRPDDRAADPPEPFRRFVEGLDLDGLGHGDATEAAR